MLNDNGYLSFDISVYLVYLMRRNYSNSWDWMEFTPIPSIKSKDLEEDIGMFHLKLSESHSSV